MALLINNIGVRRMEKYYIITNPLKDKGLTVTNRIAEYLGSRGMTVKGNMVQIKKVIKELEKAKRPIICAGGGVLLSDAEKELREFSEKYKMPPQVSLP